MKMQKRRLIFLSLLIFVFFLVIILCNLSIKDRNLKITPVNDESLNFPPVKDQNLNFPPVKVPSLNFPPVKDQNLNIPPVKVPSLNFPPVKDQNLNIPPVKDPSLNFPPVKDQNLNFPPVKYPSLNFPPVKDQNLNIPLVKDPSLNFPPVKDQNRNFPPVKDPSLNFPPAKDQNLNIPPVKDPSLNFPPVKDPSLNFPLVKDQNLNIPPVKDPSLNFPPVKDQNRNFPPVKDRSINFPLHTKFNGVVKPFLNPASMGTLKNGANLNITLQIETALRENRNRQKQYGAARTIKNRKDITEKDKPTRGSTKGQYISISKWRLIKSNSARAIRTSKRPQNEIIKYAIGNRSQIQKKKKRRRFMAQVELNRNPAQNDFNIILRKEKASQVSTESELSHKFHLLSRLVNLQLRGLLDDDLKSSETNETILVPNIVHYVWLSSGRDLAFHEMLGMMSAQKYLKPDSLKLHCDKEPTGIWWNTYKVNLTSLKIVYIDPDIRINGLIPTKIQVKSDIARNQILEKEGGIYLDFDVFVIQSFDDLRKYEFTLGLEYHGNPGRINNGIILAAPNARFFKIWFDSYKDFRQDEWDEHSCVGPYLLAPKYPDLINVDENRLNYPSGRMYHLIYYNVYNWTRNYAMHLWYRKYWRNNPPIRHFNPENIKSLNSTFGQLARRIFYNTTELMMK